MFEEGEQNIVIWQWQAVLIWDTDKSQYFAITEFNVLSFEQQISFHF